jgi:hypothetical protein
LRRSATPKAPKWASSASRWHLVGAYLTRVGASPASPFLGPSVGAFRVFIFWGWLIIPDTIYIFCAYFPFAFQLPDFRRCGYIL